MLLLGQMFWRIDSYGMTQVKQIYIVFVDRKRGRTAYPVPFAQILLEDELQSHLNGPVVVAG
jgi:hypothetical protein